MTSRSVVDWEAIHIYYFDNQDRLLMEGVKPAIDEALASREVDSFFFLRYWKGGPHVRLRLRPVDGHHGRDGAVAGIRRAVESHMRAHPGEVKVGVETLASMQEELSRLEGEDPGDLVPPNTVRDESYRPEFEKYGGAVGIEIAERLFCESSVLVLETLPVASLSMSRRLGTGYIALLAGLRASGYLDRRLLSFLAHYCRLWAPWVLPELRPQWAPRLEEYRPVLRAHSLAILGEADLPDAVRRWQAVVADTWSAVGACADVVLPQVALAGDDASDDRRRQVLLSSYLHTHNNRLGLIPASESFLGYLGHHIVAELLGTEPELER